MPAIHAPFGRFREKLRILSRWRLPAIHCSHLAALCFVLCFESANGLRAQIPYQYVDPKAPFDPAWADAQMSPGSSTLRGTITVKERKALIKALNISKAHRAPRGTIVTLFPHATHLEEWLVMDKQLSRQATLQKAAMTPEARSMRPATAPSPNPALSFLA